MLFPTGYRSEANCSASLNGVSCRSRRRSFIRAGSPGVILHQIDPGNSPGMDQPPIDLDTAWSKAVSSIVEEHNLRARSGDEMGSVGPIQQWAFEVLRDPAACCPKGPNPPTKPCQLSEAARSGSALGAIRKDLANETISPTEAAQSIVDVVHSYSLRKVAPPDPMEEITEEDIGVDCWLAVLLPSE